MKKIFLVLVILIMILYAPNFIWLVKSTAYISNRSSKALNFLSVHVDDKSVQLGKLMPDETRFIFLPRSGDATFELSYVKGGKLIFSCRQYIESEMYNVKSVINDSDSPDCSTDSPFINELFILKLLNQIK